MVGTPRKTPALGAPSFRAWLAGSKRGISATHAPHAIAAFITPDWPRTCESGVEPRTTSSGVRPSTSRPRNVRVCPEPRVRQLRSLRPAARPGGVEEDRGVAGCTADDPVDRLGPGRQLPGRRARPRLPPARRRASAGATSRTGSGVRHPALDLGAAQERIERHDDRAEAKGAVVGADEGRLVRKQDATRSPAPTPFARSRPAKRAASDPAAHRRSYAPSCSSAGPRPWRPRRLVSRSAEVCHQPRR